MVLYLGTKHEMDGPVEMKYKFSYKLLGHRGSKKILSAVSTIVHMFLMIWFDYHLTPDITDDDSKQMNCKFYILSFLTYQISQRPVTFYLLNYVIELYFYLFSLCGLLTYCLSLCTTFLRISATANVKIENCTILIPMGNSYCCCKKSASGPRFFRSYPKELPIQSSLRTL